MYLTKYLYTYDLGESKLLLNTLSGAVDILGGRQKIQFELLQNSTGSEILENSFKQELIRRGYLFSSEDEETHTFRGLWQKFYHKSSSQPLFYICPTYYCNLYCIYCNEWDMPKEAKAAGVMNTQQVRQVFQFILEVQKTRSDKRNNNGDNDAQVIVFGGEPFLRCTWAAIKEILRCAKEYNIRVTSITNGVHVDVFIDLFKRYRDILDGFAITLDGPQFIHDQRRKYLNGRGTFGQVVSNIDRLLAEGFDVDIWPVLDAQNVPFLKELANFIIAKGWKEKPNFSAYLAKAMFPLQNINDSYSFLLPDTDFLHQLLRLLNQHEELQIFEKEWMGEFQSYSYLHRVVEQQEVSSPKIQSCVAVSRGMYILGPDNLIYPCVELIGRRKFAIGKFSPDLIWSENLEMWRSWDVYRMFDKCRNCTFITLCGGGCPLPIFKGAVNEPVCPNIEKMLSIYIENRKEKILGL